MFQFVDAPRWPPDPTPSTLRGGRRLLMFCCALTIAAAACPWVEFPPLLGEVAGPRGFHTVEGVIAGLVALMVLVLLLVESGSAQSQDAVRPGILFVSWIGAATMAWRLWSGPGAGAMRGATASDTLALYVAATGSLAIAAIATWRFRPPADSPAAG